MIGRTPTDKNGTPFHMPIPKDLGKPGGPRFMDLLYYHLNVKLQEAAGGSLTKEALEDMYDIILQTVGETFSRTNAGVSQKAYRFLSQRIYESIKISTKTIQLPNPEDWDVSTKNKHVYDRIKIEELQPAELRLFAGLFSDSLFADELREGVAKLNVRA